MKREWIIWGTVLSLVLIIMILGMSGVFESDWSHGASDSFSLNVEGFALQIKNKTQADASTVSIDAELLNGTSRELPVPSFGDMYLENSLSQKFLCSDKQSGPTTTIAPGKSATLRWVFPVPDNQKWPMLLRFKVQGSRPNEFHMTISGLSQRLQTMPGSGTKSHHDESNGHHQ